MAWIKSSRVALGVGATALALVGVVVWLGLTAGRESTDDAQVDGHITQIAPRVGGTVLKVLVDDNRRVETGAVLVELDPRDYQVAVDRARAALADTQAAALAAETSVPITTTGTTSSLTTAQASVAQAASGLAAAMKQVDAARARLAAAEAKLREMQATAARAVRDAERLRGLLAKDEVSQQQFDAASAAAEASGAQVDSAKSQVTEAAAGVPLAESQLAQAEAAQRQAQAALRTAETAPAQVRQTRARAAAALAEVRQAEASLAQAELNLEYTRVTAPVAGVISRKAVEVGQVVGPSQALMALVPLENVWITANFKETQLRDMRAGQRATIRVDAYGGREYSGRVDSIAAATGARFSLLPPENATGNFVKVVQRVPVKIVLDSGQDREQRLRPGLSVVPTVYTR
jgi:membrane fusion protein (multidrug efflux system)